MQVLRFCLNGPRPSAVDFSSVTDCYKIEDVLLALEFVDHTVIADAEPILRAPSKSLMRIAGKPRTELMNFTFDGFAYVRRKLEKDGVEFARVNFGSRDSRLLRLLHTNVACGDVFLAALDAGGELVTHLELIFEVIFDPLA